jgi:hypothetical protein
MCHSTVKYRKVKSYKSLKSELHLPSKKTTLMLHAYIHTHTYIHTLHSMDPKLVNMTIGRGITHTITKTHIHYN